MVERKPLILDSVKRLLRLGVSDKEILSHLQDVGLAQREAIELLAEAKGKEKKAEEKARPRRELIAKKAEKKEKVEKPVIEREPARRMGVGELWEKGIIITVNEKLKEMKRLKEEIEGILDAKIAKAMEKERIKIEVLFESRKTLMINKINKALEEKGEEVKSTIARQLEDIKKLSLTTEEDLHKMEAKRVLIKDLYTRTNEALAELKDIKSRLLKDVSSSLSASEEKIAQLDERISRTLELESKITEGLVADARDRMEKEIDERLDGLEKDFKEKIKAIEVPEAPLAPAIAPREVRQEIDSRMKELDSKLDERLKVLDAKLKEVDAKIKEVSQFEKTISKEINSLLTTIEKRLKK